jgi:hypothetical protein
LRTQLHGATHKVVFQHLHWFQLIVNIDIQRGGKGQVGILQIAVENDQIRRRFVRVARVRLYPKGLTPAA